jgi:two-component system cell cycle response regulator
MEYLLRSFGHTTLSATDGQAGVELAERELPDLILMDLQMPTLTGHEAVRRIKEIRSLRGVPVVAVTAFAMVGDRDKILAYGFDGYLAKPITPETFVSEVEAFVSTRGTPPVVHPTTPALRRGPAPDGPAVLVVDNSPANLELAVTLLESSGYRVLVAANVGDALERARLELPDLILSDVHMPGQSGYDLLRIVKQDDALKAIPVVFISSTVWRESERAHGLQQGADGFILRPVEPEGLAAELSRYLKKTKSKGA